MLQRVMSMRHVPHTILPNRRAAHTQTLEATGPDPLSVVTGPTGPMCARTGKTPEHNSLHQDQAPRTEEEEETQRPALYEGTQGVAPEAPTYDAPTKDESFRPPFDCSAGAVATERDREGAGQPLLGHDPPACTDLGGLRSEINADQPHDIPRAVILTHHV
jgi:hypothetical protein